MYGGIDTIYLIHHSHTDIGYTHDQPVVWDLHRRFIETAIDACERAADTNEDHAFRWTVETTAMLLHWLERASPQRIDRFVELVHAGRIEVTGMLLNMSPLVDTDQLIDTLAPIHRLRRDLGIEVRHAMNSDVNGQNWPLVDVLLDAGISGFSMATNIHFGGSPLEWPNAFHWQAPSGRSIPAWNGWDYGFAHEIGIGTDAGTFRDRWWPRIDAWLRDRDYALPVLMLQVYDPFGDNGPAWPALSGFVREWNAAREGPRMRIALPCEWWEAVRRHSDALPTHAGDWTDYWNFGCGSSAREVAINRASRRRLRSADAALAALAVCGAEDDPARMPATDVRAEAWDALTLFDEHTWGADGSIRRPDDEDTVVQWQHKAAHAYTARSLSTLLARDAIAEVARRIERTPDDRLLVFNPLPAPRTVGVALWDLERLPQRGRPDDPTAARHSADRVHGLVTSDNVTEPAGAQHRHLVPVELPAFGYRTLARPAGVPEPARMSDDAVVETARHRLTFDRDGGGITSWISTALGREMVDPNAGWPFGGWIRERPSATPEDGADGRRSMWHPVERRLGLERGWRPGWPAERRGPEHLIEHRVETRTDGIDVLQRSILPGGAELRQRTYLPHWAPWIEVTSSWTMGLGTAPEATYLAFPLAVPDATGRVDLGGQAMRVDADQLPRACRDYHTVQEWVDFSSKDFGVTVACPDAPMVQVGGFTFGANQATVHLDRALLLGWVTNNYWETNFRAHQPGLVNARYRFLPHAGAFDEAAAHRFGREAGAPPLVQRLDEPSMETSPLPSNGALLDLPAEPVLVLRVWTEDRAVWLRLLNASDDRAEAQIGSGSLVIERATRCDLLGEPIGEVTIDDGAVTVPMEPRAVATLRLDPTSL